MSLKAILILLKMEMQSISIDYYFIPLTPRWDFEEEEHESSVKTSNFICLSPMEIISDQTEIVKKISELFSVRMFVFIFAYLHRYPLRQQNNY
jgi:hypothetical protein